MPVDPSDTPRHAVYGTLLNGLLDLPAKGSQCSPRVPGVHVLSDFLPETCDGLVVHVPAGTVERRCVLALALKALRRGAPLTAFAANKKGGTRIAKELAAFGCEVDASHRRHHQIVDTVRCGELVGLDAAIAAGAPRFCDQLGLWTQPGLFSWDRIDPGSQMLLDHLPALAGRGADVGCGTGLLAHAVLEGPHCRHVTLIDIDRRALDVAARNVPDDARVTTLWADVRKAGALPRELDFIVMNPPFHDGGNEDKALGRTFIQAAAGMLRRDGQLWLTANRHLPYEDVLQDAFASFELLAQARGYKVYVATK